MVTNRLCQWLHLICLVSVIGQLGCHFSMSTRAGSCVLTSGSRMSAKWPTSPNTPFITVPWSMSGYCLNHAISSASSPDHPTDQELLWKGLKGEEGRVCIVQYTSIRSTSHDREQELRTLVRQSGVSPNNWHQALTNPAPLPLSLPRCHLRAIQASNPSGEQKPLCWRNPSLCFLWLVCLTSSNTQKHIIMILTY